MIRSIGSMTGCQITPPACATSRSLRPPPLPARCARRGGEVRPSFNKRQSVLAPAFFPVAEGLTGKMFLSACAKETDGGNQKLLPRLRHGEDFPQRQGDGAGRGAAAGAG